MTQDKISIIITILNGEKWIGNCMQSIVRQTAVQQQIQQRKLQQKVNIISKVTSAAANDNVPSANIAVELCVFDDCSTDETLELLKRWQTKFQQLNICMHIVQNRFDKPKGVGYGRNMAIAASSGDYLCFQDIDDEMYPQRLIKQYMAAKEFQNAIIGSKFIRIPKNSTYRFTRWANEISEQKLNIQIYTANGPTIIMPTWMCHRRVYNKIPKGFSEDGPGTPEDLIFFYKHFDYGGQIIRVDEYLVKYRYHTEATTFTIAAKTIWRLRLQHLIVNVLEHMPWSNGFTIWNAGKQGRKFFRDLPEQEKDKVVAFCDVDKKKIFKYYKHYDALKRKITYDIPIIHFTKAQAPLLICMKLDLTHGAFEANLKSLNLTEGKDYILFT